MLRDHRLTRFFLVFALLSAGIVGWGCSGTEKITNTVSAPRPSSIIVFPAEVLLSSIGSTMLITATVRDDTGFSISGVNVAWDSSDHAMATVTSSGLVTAVSAGQAKITATHGTLKATATVSVSGNGGGQ